MLYTRELIFKQERRTEGAKEEKKITQTKKHRLIKLFVNFFCYFDKEEKKISF